MTPDEEARFLRRRRARNLAIMAALLALCALFYFISIARMSRHG